METLENRLQKKVHVFLYALVFLAVLLGLSVLLEGCTDDCESRLEYTYYEPVYTPLETIRAGVSQAEPAPIQSVGKIYFKDGWLFLNEPGKGIHVIDNRDPSNPQPKSFVNVPGNYDIAAKGNMLYADSYIDLVLLDITSPSDIHEVGRMENVFSAYNSMGFGMDPEKGLVTDWVEKTHVEIDQTDCDAHYMPWGGFYYETGIAMPVMAFFDKSAALAPGTGSGPGVGGSMARFTIAFDHLFVLDQGHVQSINIAGSSPELEGKTLVSYWGDLETIFPYGNNLFVGARSGMHIMDVSTPSEPVMISTYQHVNVCDPVVVQDTIAYVTLRSGTTCEGFTNQLEVINIKDLSNPQVIATYPMTNPHGLGIDQSILFICDGAAGLKVYDASDVQAIAGHQLAHYADIQATDVIPFNNVLMMIGEDGISQFDYSDPANITLLSSLPVVHED